MRCPDRGRGAAHARSVAASRSERGQLVKTAAMRGGFRAQLEGLGICLKNSGPSTAFGVHLTPLRMSVRCLTLLRMRVQEDESGEDNAARSIRPSITVLIASE